MRKTILLLETSSETCSVALAEFNSDDMGAAGKLLGEELERQPMRHTQVLVPLIDEVLKKASLSYADLSAVATSSGPGSYTALRAGLSTAKGLCTVLDIPLIQIPTHLALAAQGLKTFDFRDTIEEVVALLPARRMEWYYARYNAQLSELAPAQLINIDTPEKAETLVGNVTNTLLVSPSYENSAFDFENFRAITVEIHAHNMILPAIQKFINADFSDLSSSSPNYVRKPFITRAKPRV